MSEPSCCTSGQCRLMMQLRPACPISSPHSPLHVLAERVPHRQLLSSEGAHALGQRRRAVRVLFEKRLPARRGGGGREGEEAGRLLCAAAASGPASCWPAARAAAAHSVEKERERLRKTHLRTHSARHCLYAAGRRRTTSSSCTAPSCRASASLHSRQPGQGTGHASERGCAGGQQRTSAVGCLWSLHRATAQQPRCHPPSLKPPHRYSASLFFISRILLCCPLMVRSCEKTSRVSAFCTGGGEETR